MSMLFSGFATRQHQQLYDNLVEQLISVLCKRISKIYDGQQCNEHAFKMVLLKIMVNLNILEEKKYSPPKLSQQAKDLMHLLQLDYLTSQSQQQNGVIKTKKKEYQLLNQSDLLSKKANFQVNKQRSITPMSGGNLNRITQRRDSQQNPIQPHRVNSSIATNKTQNPIVDGQIILPPQTAIGGDKNGYRVRLYNKNEENLYGPNIQLKQASKMEDTSSKNTIQSYDVSKDISGNLKENNSYVNCYESINVKKINNNNNHNLNHQQQMQENNSSYYQPYHPQTNTHYSQRTSEISSLSPPPAAKTQFQNSFEVILERISDQNPQLAQKIDNYSTLSANKGYSINQDLDCPQPSVNFPSEQKSIYNQNQNNSNKSSYYENEVEQTMIDQDIIKKIINIAPQIGKLSKQERQIDKSFRRLRKKSQQQNNPINNNSLNSDVKNELEFDSDKYESDFYYGNFVSSTTSAGSQRLGDTTRANRKNGFFSAQRSNFK